ncbi:hypothetical protein BHE74_00028819 [Ensete ventricosum]|nr:hypothetical protein BHE74_00028819 [Ensete ventricosum]
MCSCHGRLPVEGASEKEEPAAKGIGRCGWLATTGASATAVAATGDCSAAVEREGEIWSNPLTLIAEGWPAVGEQKFDGSDRERRLEQSRRSDPVMGASGYSALLLWLKGTPGCEGALRVAIGEEVLGSAEAE